MAAQYIVFARKREQARVKRQVERVVQTYETFLLVEATDAQVKALREAGFVVERRATQDRPPAAEGEPPSTMSEGRHHFIVTFVGPIRPEWLRALTERGGILREVMPPYGYVVELDTADVAAVRDLAFVQSVEWYEPTSRIAEDVWAAIKGEATGPRATPPRPTPSPPSGPELAEEAEAAPGASPPEPSPVPEEGLAVGIQRGVVRVVFFTRDQRDAAVAQLQAQGVRVRSLEDESETDMLLFLPEDEAQARDLILTVSRIHGVQTIAPVILPGLANDVAARIVGVDVVRDRETSRRFTGEGEIVGVPDTGLDTGNPTTIHPDFRGRIAGIVSWPVSLGYGVMNPGADDGAADTVTGHGTHVSGCIVGTGAAAAAHHLEPIRGMAPGARLFFQAVQQETALMNGRRTYALTGFPSDLRKMLQQAYDAGARVYNISMSFSTAGQYDLIAWQIDDFVWRHPDMVVVVAAGNESRDENRDGRVEPGSVTSPGTAKNVITVGACENVRRTIGLNMTWGQAWPSDFPAPPLRDDHIANSADHIAAFSGRGPTRDGRFKPDVVAPGTNIVSTRSQALAPNRTGWGPHPQLPTYYMADGGTSMASPIVAGAAAILRQYLRTVKRRRPSAALVKALIIHSAVYFHYDLDPGDGPFDFAQGWGRMSLARVVEPSPPLKVHMYERRSGLMTGEHITRWADVHDSTEPLSVTLVWTDPPGSPRQVRQLVNDLDLVVIAPDGKRYHGNQFSPPHDQAFDRVNNVERVIIPHPIPGRYWLRVYATNVPLGPQGFALVWSCA